MNIDLKMTSKEIAELTGKQHRNVMRDIRKMLEELDLKIGSFLSTSKDSMNREQEIYSLPKREVEILITGYSIKLRAKVIDRLREVEQKLVSQIPQVSLPHNYKEALIALVEAEEHKERQQKMIEAQKPFVKIANHLMASSNTISITDCAKVICKQGIKTGQNRLFKFLKENKILMKSNLPYQTFIDQGYFEVKEGIIDTAKGSRVTFKTMVTGKGQVAILNKMKKGVE